MTRKDFVLIADTIRDLEVEAPVKDAIAEKFATALLPSHPFFDTAKFIESATGYYAEQK